MALTNVNLENGADDVIRHLWPSAGSPGQEVYGEN